MPEEKKPQKTRALILQKARERVRVESLVKQRWFRVSPVFFLGTIVTAGGTTVYKSDATIFAGMILMGLGVIAMWIAETGRLKLKTLPGPALFIIGSVLTAISMTIDPSNPLLCAGMILTGLGTIVMWQVSVGKWGFSAAVVAVLFSAGIILEALSLTVIASDLMVMIGMIATGMGAFAMWAFGLVDEREKEKEEEKPAAQKTAAGEAKE